MAYTDPNFVVTLECKSSLLPEEMFDSLPFSISGLSFSPSWCYQGTNPDGKVNLVFSGGAPPESGVVVLDESVSNLKAVNGELVLPQVVGSFDTGV